MNPFSWRGLQTEVFNQRSVRYITEGYLIKLHISFYICEKLCSIRAFRLLFQKCEDPGRAGKGILQLSHNGTDIVKRFHILIGVCQHDGKSAYSQSAARNQKCTDKSNCSINDIVDKTGAGVGQAAVKNCFQTGALQFFIDLAETLRSFV